jgi:hypothetical protein
MGAVSPLRFIAAANTCRAAPPSARRSITRLLRLQLIKHAAPGFQLRSGGSEILVYEGQMYEGQTPHWVREQIERVRNAHRRP